MKFVRFFCCLLIVYAFSILGAYGAGGGLVSGWYLSLKKPAFTPPYYLFGLIWGVVYTFLTFSLWLVWEKSRVRTVPFTAFGLFFLALFLTVLWPAVLFGFYWITGALALLFCLWIVVILAMLYCGKYSILAGVLYVPFFLWITFALYLNSGLVLLN
ncbi:MAG: hypothetical protein A3F09_04730 [Chlamydiae bacterium RIFCSPHIGHO2_12_FULL_49_11]|nr:MAG: hypothetical protein A3F09_04730 [Chlamydiae bacterium RIFCSPHIGHO2_12_FULL_49_11]